MHNSTLNLENPRASKPLSPGGHPGSVQGVGSAAREKGLQQIEGMKISQSAVQGIGMSTKAIRGTWMSNPNYALAVSLIFTRATSQAIIFGTEPKHVLSTALLYNSLLHDSRFMQVPIGQTAPGDRRTAGLRGVHDARREPSNCETLDNGTVVNRDGHHVSPVQTWKDQNGKTIFSKDVTDRLNEVRIGNDEVNHNFPSAHRSYNTRAQEITDGFIKEAKGAGIDPAMLKGPEARDFADRLIKKLEDDPFLSKFNEMVKEGKGTKEALNAMRDAAIVEGILKESDAPSALGKLGQLLAEKGGAISEHLPGVLKALGLAAALAEFRSDAKANGVKQAARTQYYRFSDLLGQTPEEDQAMRQKVSHWFYKMIGADADDQKQ